MSLHTSTVCHSTYTEILLITCTTCCIFIVCGEQYVGAQSLAVQHLTSLRHLYNTTLLEPLITRVILDIIINHFTFYKEQEMFEDTKWVIRTCKSRPSKCGG